MLFPLGLGMRRPREVVHVLGEISSFATSDKKLSNQTSSEKGFSMFFVGFTESYYTRELYLFPMLLGQMLVDRGNLCHTIKMGNTLLRNMFTSCETTIRSGKKPVY